MMKPKISATSQTLLNERPYSISDGETTLPWSRYLEQVDQHLGKLTCGLLIRADLDHNWRAAWSTQVAPEQAVELALAADGFMVSRLPSPSMRHLASGYGKSGSSGM